ncbi:hypothetical protein GOB57_22100 [Sinorhizobium meliloti]|nr:hypothetical protein [Sinorhizobium meliloti]
MEKWSPEQWGRLFADVKKKEDIVAHQSRFTSDVRAVRDAGYSVVLVERGAFIDDRILISNRGPSWKTARSPSWYGYPDVSKLIRFLQTGEWEQTEEARRTAEKRARAREKNQPAGATAREKVKAKNREERERQAEILRGVKERRAARLAAKREDGEKRKAASERAKQKRLAATTKNSDVVDPD